MKRLQRQAENNEVVSGIVKGILDNGESKEIVRKFIEDWLEDNVTEYELDVAVLQEEFEEQALNTPDNLFEKLIDLVPNEGDDDKLYNASSEEKKTAIKTILDKYDLEIVQEIERAINDEEVIRSEDKYDNNAPYGPGMNQRDFV